MTKFHLWRLALRFVRFFSYRRTALCIHTDRYTYRNAIFRVLRDKGPYKMKAKFQIRWNIFLFLYSNITWRNAVCVLVSQHVGIIAYRIGRIMRYWHNMTYTGMILCPNLYHSVMTWASLQWTFGIMISHSHNDLPLYRHNDILAYLHICILSISWHNDILAYWPYHDVMMLLSLQWPPQGSESHEIPLLYWHIHGNTWHKDILNLKLLYWLIKILANDTGMTF